MDPDLRRGDHAVGDTVCLGTTGRPWLARRFQRRRASVARGREHAVNDGAETRPQPLGLGWPNVISIARVCLIPAILLLIAQASVAALWTASILFAIGAATDFLDGYLARRHAMTTAVGAWLDPLSDKLFVAAPAVLLSFEGRFPVWATVVIVGREVIVQFLRWRLDRRGVSMPASKVAKLKTVSQLLAIGFAIPPLAGGWGPIETVAAVLAVVLTVYSGAEYLLTSRHQVPA